MKYRFFNILRHLALMLLVIWTVVSLVTFLMNIVPGGPAAATLGESATQEQIEDFNRRYGLDRPAFFFSYDSDKGFVWNGSDNQYADYWIGVLHGDLGKSFRTDRPVRDMILERYPATIELAIAAMLVAVGIALPLGVLSGARKNSIIDNFAS